MPIQQHPLPQDVTGYKFRLVGDMTLKQFLMLAVNIVLCIVLYGSPLPFFFRIPLSALFLILGIGLAFVPVQGRPLDQWLIAFIRSIYAPTQYRWANRQTQSTIQTPPATPLPPVSPNPTPTPITPQPTPIPVLTVPVQKSTPPPPPQTQSTIQTPPATPLPPVSPNPTPTPITPQPIQTNPAPTPVPSAPIPQPQITPSTQTTNNMSNLPIPFTPTTPNTIVGLTIDNDNKILDGVLIEIKTNGLTVRATKSNKLGQFMFARALENGLYQIAAEKSGYNFDTYSLNLHGQIINPLKIQTKL